MSSFDPNPSGDDIAAEPAWVGRVVSSWRYPEADRRWFLERLATVPGQATVAGGFITNVLDLLPQTVARADLLRELHFAEAPSRFRPAPLNHFLLSAVHIAHRLGHAPTLAGDMPHLQDAVDRSMAAALIRATLPGFAGMKRIREVLRLVSRAFSGTMFSHLRLTVEQGGDDHWIVHHEGEHNFLAHFHYQGAYLSLLGPPFGPARRVEFDWVGPAQARAIVWAS